MNLPALRKLDVQPDEYIDDVCGTYFRGYCLEEAGTYFKQHSHDYSHATLIATGGIRVWVEDKFIGDFYAPKAVEIEAGKKHTFQSLRPQTWFYCVHNLNGKQYQILEEHQETSK